MSLDQQLRDQMLDAANAADQLPPTRAGVDAAVRRRAARRRRLTISGAVAALVLPAVGALAITAGDGDGGGPMAEEGVVDGSAEHLPLVGIDLVGFTLRPELDPDPPRVGGDLTYAAFTGDEPDVLGPMITASAQSGDWDPSGTPVDLDLDGADGGVDDGRMSTFPDGAVVSWTVDGAIASINGHGVPPEDVLAYARQLSGVPFDLETIPAPQQLPHREVVTFEPEPDFSSRISSYEGPPGVIHVLTTDDRGYYDLTRIVSTEGVPYEEVPLGRTFLGEGTAILSQDDDGMTSALVQAGGLVVHVFGPNLDADTLRTALRYGHLTDLSEGAGPPPTTAEIPIIPLEDDLGASFYEGLRPPPGNASYAEVRRYAITAGTAYEVRFRPHAGGEAVWWDDSQPHVVACAGLAPADGPYITILTTIGPSSESNLEGDVVRSGERIGVTFCTAETWSVFYIPVSIVDDSPVDDSHPSRIRVNTQG